MDVFESVVLTSNNFAIIGFAVEVESVCTPLIHNITTHKHRTGLSQRGRRSLCFRLIRNLTFLCQLAASMRDMSNKALEVEGAKISPIFAAAIGPKKQGRLSCGYVWSTSYVLNTKSSFNVRHACDKMSMEGGRVD